MKVLFLINRDHRPLETYHGVPFATRAGREDGNNLRDCNPRDRSYDDHSTTAAFQNTKSFKKVQTLTVFVTRQESRFTYALPLPHNSMHTIAVTAILLATDRDAIVLLLHFWLGNTIF